MQQPENKKAEEPTEKDFYNHQEFLKMSKGHMNKALHDFLSQREDGAGASANAWMTLSDLGADPAFLAMKPHERQAKTVEIIGEEAFAAYRDYIVRNWQG